LLSFRHLSGDYRASDRYHLLVSEELLSLQAGVLKGQLKEYYEKTWQLEDSDAHEESTSSEDDDDDDDDSDYEKKSGKGSYY
jgi:hypothetical protein